MSRLDLDKNMVKALVEAIRLSETIKPSQDAKRRAFRKYGYLGGPRDPLLTAVFYGVMLHQGILDTAIRDLVGVDPLILDPWLRAALRLLLEVKLYRDPSRRTMRYLRNAVASLLSAETHPYVGMYYTRLYDRIISIDYKYVPRSRDEEDMMKYLLPIWYMSKMRMLLDSEATELFKALNTRLPLSVRVNILKTSVEKVYEELSREVEWVEKSSVVPTVLRFPGPYNFENSRLWREGKIIIQEEAAAAASIVLSPKPGETVVDLAAAPGGKTEHMAELMENNGRIIAFDINRERIKRMKKLLRRTGIKIARIINEDSRKAPQIIGEGRADKVLLDAPCSSDGTLMKNPDLRWRLREEKVRDLSELQYQLLEAGWKILKKGGRLLYCTCSMLTEENEAVIKRFLEEHDDAELVRLSWPYDRGFLEGTRRSWPHRHKTIGFFYALIEKK